jgi:hypothetical protein
VIRRQVAASLLACFAIQGCAADAPPSPVDAPRAVATAPPPARDSDPPVKLSRTGLCHAPGTAYYESTEAFTPFESLEACLAAGGRYPKGQEPGGGPAVKLSRSGICHGRSSPAYRATDHYIAYDTLDDCLKAGGRLPR